MGNDKAAHSSSQSKMDQCTSLPQPGGPQGSRVPLDPVTNVGAADILKAIQDSCAALESQIGGVQVEVSLVRQDLRNVVDRVTEAEGRISELKDTVKAHHSTMRQLSAMRVL